MNKTGSAVAINQRVKYNTLIYSSFYAGIT